MPKKKIRWKNYVPFYIMALPGIIYMICNNYMPMFGIVLAFKKLDVTKGILGSPWAGFKNFEFLFKTKATIGIIRNTVLYNLLFLFLGTALAVALAILLNEVKSRKMGKLYQSLILIPYLMSWVIASYLVYAFLAQDIGIINNSILRPLGQDAINWYSEKKYWPYILTFAYMWKNIGYMMIIYYSSIVGLSADYFEAASLDGATKWQQIRQITLPLIKGTIITMVILNLGRIVTSDFSLFYQIPKNNGALYSVTQTLDVYVYNALMKNSDFAMSSAASVFQSIVGFIFVLITNAVVRKYNEESALF
ncbi:MAG TPA: sugar ABC transporter permease [Lachnospiraceae bacterium]|nr:sugar ABC transporter permease [Lachnospiraceae bacterium]